MKVLSDINLEVLLGGVFGAMALIAIFVEMAIGNFELPALASGIKDISGTLVAVMVFVIAAKSLFKKEDKSFSSVFIEEMKNIENKYTPLLRLATDNGDERRAQKLNSIVRYELSTNIDALLDGEVKTYANFFEFDINQPVKVSFSINKTTFMGRSQESFEPLKEEIRKNIRLGIQIRNKKFAKGFKSTANGFVVDFEEPLISKADAMGLVDFIDTVILFYIALCKKTTK